MPTQEDCRLEFAIAMEKLVDQLDEIDGKTPHSGTEPVWWIRMIELRQLAQRYAVDYGVPARVSLRDPSDTKA